MVIDLRDVRDQINDFVGRLPEGDAHAALREQAKTVTDQLTEVEKSLYQTKNRSRQDPLNFPIKLTNKLAHLNSLAGIGDFRPTEQSYTVKEEITQLINEELADYNRIMNQEIPKLNQLIRESQVDLISGPRAKP